MASGTISHVPLGQWTVSQKAGADALYTLHILGARCQIGLFINTFSDSEDIIIELLYSVWGFQFR